LPSYAKSWSGRRRSPTGCELRVRSGLIADEMALHAIWRKFRPHTGDAPRADARPADLAGKPPVFDLGTAVHDHLQPRGLGLRGRLIITNSELHPNNAESEAIL